MVTGGWQTADATPRLVALLASDRTEEARLACKTLASLATDPRGRLAINALPDAIPAVFSVLDSSDLEVTTHRVTKGFCATMNRLGCP